jgi:hypothetical protein
MGLQCLFTGILSGLNKVCESWGCISVIEYFSHMHKALGTQGCGGVGSEEERRKKKEEGEEEEEEEERRRRKEVKVGQKTEAGGLQV